MPISEDELSKKAKGGTEQMKNALLEKLGENFLADFQIIPSRVRELDESKLRVLWCHDLPEDPESKHLANGDWKKFHKIVFVSNWQAQRYIETYNIPWSKTVVLKNAIEPIVNVEKSYDTINLVYHTTPHRGLELLVPVFNKLCEKHRDIHLDVFSSFKAYGWEERDTPYKKLFDEVIAHQNMTYHGFQENSVVRKKLSESHIMAYPSIWPETSCIALMEAMSAGLLCVHPNFAALPETACDWTMMYGFIENKSAHASQFYQVLDGAIELIKTNKDDINMKLKGQQSYVNLFYSWDVRIRQWEHMLNSLRNMPRNFEKDVFSYSS
jgi:glycosyltransferase involved in cell wall biosynthesis